MWLGYTTERENLVDIDKDESIPLVTEGWNDESKTDVEPSGSPQDQGGCDESHGVETEQAEEEAEEQVTGGGAF